VLPLLRRLSGYDGKGVHLLRVAAVSGLYQPVFVPAALPGQEPQLKKMPLLSRRTAVGKSSLRSLNALQCKAFRGFDPIRGGLPPPRAPPPKLRRILLNRGFLTS